MFIKTREDEDISLEEIETKIKNDIDTAASNIEDVAERETFVSHWLNEYENSKKYWIEETRYSIQRLSGLPLKSVEYEKVTDAIENSCHVVERDIFVDLCKSGSLGVDSGHGYFARYIDGELCFNPTVFYSIYYKTIPEDTTHILWKNY